MDIIQASVDDLYRFRDHFFENHAISRANEKKKLVKEKLEECIKRLDEIKVGDPKDQSEPSATEDDFDLLSNPNIDDKAKILYFRGRALNVTDDHDPECEKLLSKAVKLEPSFVEAWNELGESYWKRGDVDNAFNCFEGALNHRQNKISLRNTSIVLRQKQTSSTEERLRNIEKGLTRAREAVQLDTSDGKSWTILGNAYFSHFFSISQNPRTLKQAMSAYRQAEKDTVASSSPELFYNKGIAFRYEELYNESLECFKQARLLDPTWTSATQQETALIKSLTSIQALLENRGKLKNKKFQNLVESIDSKKSLGPYHLDARANSGAKPLQEAVFSELVEGTNEGKVILGKVTCSIFSEETVPFTFCMTDKKGECVAVNLYNLAPGKGVIIGDSVAISEPQFRSVSISHGKHNIRFNLIRVESPLVLVINGKKTGADFQAGIELSTFTKCD